MDYTVRTVGILAGVLMVVTAGANFQAHAADANAQQASGANAPVAAAAAKQDAGSMEARLNLAKMMHEVKPAREQVDAAIRNVAKNLPADQQQEFISRMTNAFDYKKLEELSIHSMAEVFTEDELQKMVEYYGSPEAHSIEEKMPVYQSVMQPEVTKMIDAAMMQARTGGPPDTPPVPSKAPVKK